jgi:hypothetical protein
LLPWKLGSACRWSVPAEHLSRWAPVWNKQERYFGFLKNHALSWTHGCNLTQYYSFHLTIL